MSGRIDSCGRGVTSESEQVQMKLISGHQNNVQHSSDDGMPSRGKNVAEAIAHVSDEVDDDAPDICSDLYNVMLLVMLYLMQGIPLGLLGSISMMLQKRGASYQTQAKFSIVTWPFNLKLLWAPIVDSCFSARFGRRKSWLVPVQLLIGLFMLFMSYHIEYWLGDENNEADIGVLTILFLILLFLVATQDIATDGWSLTMLQRRNVGYATVCNSIGQTLGAFFSYTMLISLESAEFCNTYLRSQPLDKGVISLSDFFFFCGASYILITTMIGIFKNEETIAAVASIEHTHKYTSVLATYRMALKILKIPSIRLLAAILLTYKLIWADYDAVSYFKFLDSGISNEKMISWSAIFSIPVSLATSAIIAKHVAGANLIRTFIYPMPFRTVFALIGAAIVWLTPKLIPSTGVAPTYIYFVFMGNDFLYMIFTTSMQFGMAAFFLKISDPAVGATYVTLLNTIINWGSTWPYSLALWLVEYLTWRDCVLSNDPRHNGTSFMGDSHNSSEMPNKKCPIYIDGYYVETAICFLFGIVWYRWGIKAIRHLQMVPIEAWKVCKT